MRKIIIAMGIVFSLVLSVSCNKQEAPKVEATSSMELNVYNWEAYMPPEVLEAFTKETGIKVNYEEFDSNETMIAKVKQGVQYDITFPSQDFVPSMIKDGLLLELDLKKIPNLSSIDPAVIQMTQSYDPSNKYSVPYNIGSTGIIYWKDKVKNPGNSWQILLDPALKNKILLMDDTREILGAALKTFGYSVNTTNQSEIDKAVELVLKWKANALKFESDAMSTMFISKDVWVAFGYPENIISEMDDAQKANVGFFLPKEHGVKYLDNIVILKNSKNIENAYKFINFIYKPENLAKISDLYGYPGISQAANKLRKSTPNYSAQDIADNEFRMALDDKLEMYTKPWEEKIKIGQ